MVVRDYHADLSTETDRPKQDRDLPKQSMSKTSPVALYSLFTDMTFTASHHSTDEDAPGNLLMSQYALQNARTVFPVSAEKHVVAPTAELPDLPVLDWSPTRRASLVEPLKNLVDHVSTIETVSNRDFLSKHSDRVGHKVSEMNIDFVRDALDLAFFIPALCETDRSVSQPRNDAPPTRRNDTRKITGKQDNPFRGNTAAMLHTTDPREPVTPRDSGTALSTVKGVATKISISTLDMTDDMHYLGMFIA